MDPMLSLQIESLIFAAVKPINLFEIKDAIDGVSGKEMSIDSIESAINEVIKKYEHPNLAIEIVEMSGGFTFMSKPQYHNVLSVFLKQTEQKKLSKAALETLSIIAYKQPCTRSDIEAIRGVNCDYAIQKLLDKQLIDIKGRSEGPGKPLLYATSEMFMNHFGLRSIGDLPTLKEIKEDIENTIGSVG